MGRIDGALDVATLAETQPFDGIGGQENVGRLGGVVALGGTEESEAFFGNFQPAVVNLQFDLRGRRLIAAAVVLSIVLRTLTTLAALVILAALIILAVLIVSAAASASTSAAMALLVAGMMMASLVVLTPLKSAALIILAVLVIAPLVTALVVAALIGVLVVLAALAALVGIVLVIAAATVLRSVGLGVGRGGLCGGGGLPGHRGGLIVSFRIHKHTSKNADKTLVTCRKGLNPKAAETYNSREPQELRLGEANSRNAFNGSGQTSDGPIRRLEGGAVQPLFMVCTD
jgi:hypothetical protein